MKIQKLQAFLLSIIKMTVKMRILKYLRNYDDRKKKIKVSNILNSIIIFHIIYLSNSVNDIFEGNP